MKSQPGQRAIKINIFPNISPSKDNQTMKLNQGRLVSEQFQQFEDCAVNPYKHFKNDLQHGFENF